MVVVYYGGGRGKMEREDFDELFINKPISFSSEIVQQFNCWRKCILAVIIRSQFKLGMDVHNLENLYNSNGWFILESMDPNGDFVLRKYLHLFIYLYLF